MSELIEISRNLFLLESINYLFFLFVLLLNKETTLLVKIMFFINNMMIAGLYHLEISISNKTNKHFI